MKEILILEGGFNEEHKVSLKTSNEVRKILKKNNFKFKTLLVNPKTFKKDIIHYSNNFLCFNALHGPFGEDGKIQKILSNQKFKFTHSGINSSKTCFSKVKSKIKIIKNNIPTPAFLEINSNLLNKNYLNKCKKKFDKFIIKPNESGSSFGIRIIKNDNDFNNLINNLAKYKKEIINHQSLIIEKYIAGSELTVSVLEFENNIEALEVTEILTKNKFFDYKAKYSRGFSKHILPAKIPKAIHKKCLQYALNAHKVLNCKSISRSDFIFNKVDHKIYYLETNTQPGLTPISLVPEQAKFKKISFERMILQILKTANE